MCWIDPGNDCPVGVYYNVYNYGHPWRCIGEKLYSEERRRSLDRDRRIKKLAEELGVEIDFI